MFTACQRRFKTKTWLFNGECKYFPFTALWTAIAAFAEICRDVIILAFYCQRGSGRHPGTVVTRYGASGRLARLVSLQLSAG